MAEEMIEIPAKCEFLIDNPDRIQQITKTNGDRIIISKIHLTAGQAAALSYLINNKEPLSIEIKKKEM